MRSYSIKTFFKEFVEDAISDIAQTHPYHAFFLISSSIELLGKCLNPTIDWYADGTSEKDFYNAIDTFNALNKYKVFDEMVTDKKGKQKRKNKLYTSLRCGLFHSFLPNSGIVLSKGKNDLTQKIVGCNELFHDIIDAWAELEEKTKKNLDDIVFYTNGPLSANTSTIQTEQLDGGAV